MHENLAIKGQHEFMSSAGLAWITFYRIQDQILVSAFLKYQVKYSIDQVK